VIAELTGRIWLRAFFFFSNIKYYIYHGGCGLFKTQTPDNKADHFALALMLLESSVALML